MLTVVVTMKPKRDDVAEFEKNLAELLERVKSEPGCVGVTWGPVVDQDVYAIVESYADEAAREVHLRSEALAEYGPVLAGLLDGAPSSFVFAHSAAGESA
ncbi:hypothetical protein MPRF_01020 [Mycolicibacterium parafortuitum]|uniref:ABM domain-containing protein n=2 Tax=Mycolicibacterium parafortuitum TaxID=39692 RepID=A0A7I7TX56_MYCPF|nr:hypothetical protein MPRF_01020 [Mycolicibacterium parafortuitum]